MSFFYQFYFPCWYTKELKDFYKKSCDYMYGVKTGFQCDLSSFFLFSYNKISVSGILNYCYFNVIPCKGKTDIANMFFNHFSSDYTIYSNSYQLHRVSKLTLDLPKNAKFSKFSMILFIVYVSFLIIHILVLIGCWHLLIKFTFFYSGLIVIAFQKIVGSWVILKDILNFVLLF